ncbi:MAG: 7-cyano-7-deazaguanine synthase, partial [Oscillospiraceae bacterium]|nr:7-cyano-7-deazaguanine synthase [Oscillospiraceae bacterium]
MTTPSTNKGVLVGISGGVDSAVCCMLLKDAGYEVSALYCVMSERHLAGIAAAEATADELGIRLHTVDLREEFKVSVIIPFADSYSAGKTPNPCVVCNPKVKFRNLAATAEKLGAARIATGHYARIAELGGKRVIQRAADIKRDQSYMLYRLNQDVLRDII